MVFYRVKHKETREVLLETESEAEAVVRMEKGLICEVCNRFADGEEETRYVMKYTLEPDKDSGYFRLRAVADIPDVVAYGGRGGLVSSKNVMSHKGKCWVGEHASALNGSFIEGDAYVGGHAKVDGSHISGNARVTDYAEVSFCKVRDNAVVGGHVRIDNYNICGGSELDFYGDMNSLNVEKPEELRDIVLKTGAAVIKGKLPNQIDISGPRQIGLFEGVIPEKSVIFVKLQERPVILTVIEPFNVIFTDIMAFREYVIDEYGNRPEIENVKAAIDWIAIHAGIDKTTINNILNRK